MRPPNRRRFAKILRSLGYELVPQQQQWVLCFKHDKMKIVVLGKSNRCDDEQMAKYLSVMQLPRPFFEPIYKNCCKNRPR